MAYLGHNFVFEAPSITRLADLLFRDIHSSSVPALEERSNEKEMFHLLEKYTSNLPTRPHDMMEDERSGDVILLTGTTGGFGCNILAHLSLDTSVKKVYALNRHSASDGVIQRQIATMNKLGLLEDCLHCPKFHLLEGDLSQPTLGLEPGVLEIVCFISWLCCTNGR